MKEQMTGRRRIQHQKPHFFTLAAGPIASARANKTSRDHSRQTSVSPPAGPCAAGPGPSYPRSPPPEGNLVPDHRALAQPLWTPAGGAPSHVPRPTCLAFYLCTKFVYLGTSRASGRHWCRGTGDPAGLLRLMRSGPSFGRDGLPDHVGAYFRNADLILASVRDISRGTRADSAPARFHSQNIINGLLLFDRIPSIGSHATKILRGTGTVSRVYVAARRAGVKSESPNAQQDLRLGALTST